jgi:hypothetical protein
MNHNLISSYYLQICITGIKEQLQHQQNGVKKKKTLKIEHMKQSGRQAVPSPLAARSHTMLLMG